MQLAIIDYNAGNVQSVLFALKRLGVEAVLSRDKEELRAADKVIFPGVGEAAYAMEHLRKYDLDTFIPSLTQPVLGICLGMQLMCEDSEERDTPCLGIFPEKVIQFKGDFKIPHMGWNQLEEIDGAIYPKVNEVAPYAYFVHSYYVPLNEYTTARTNYGLPFSASMSKDNFHASQFHPEKSGPFGAQLLKNFLAL